VIGKVDHSISFLLSAKLPHDIVLCLVFH